MREIQMLPSATATETFKRMYGTLRRPLGEQNDPLQYAVGAKIVGVEFPPRYNGDWAVGWADGRRAAFPCDTVKLDPPLKTEIKMQGTSSLKAVARFKFAPRDNEQIQAEWLHFKKGDTITNIACKCHTLPRGYSTMHTY